MSAEDVTEKTRAILAIQQELQDVTAAIRQIKALLEAQRAERDAWKSVIYRILTSGTSLLFPDKNNSSPMDKHENRGNMPKQHEPPAR